MAPLFPPWFDDLARVVMLSIGLSVVGIPALLMVWVRTSYQNDVGVAVAQPVQFDHRHHVRDDGIDCLYCHYDAERSPTAGVPDTATCMGCHAQIYQDSPQLEPVRDSYYADQPLRWRRVHDLPDFVYFDHSIHLSRGVGCETCHGRVDRMAAVSKAESLHMGWCLECHRDPVPYLRPPQSVTEMGYHPAIPQRKLGERLVAELNIKPPTNCSGCHR